MSITFQYPAYNPSVSLTLPAPQLNDNTGSTYETTVHLTRDSNFKTIVSHDRNEIYATTLEFIKLCREDKEALETFILGAQGNYIKYTDYEGGNWICLLLDQELEIIAVSKGPVYDVTLTFNRWETT